MVFCRFLPLPVLLSAGLAGVGAMDLHEQRMMEAPSLLRGGASSDEIKVVTVPVDVLHSAQFSSLLDAYLEDTALERALGECRLWIDVGRFRGKQTTTDPLPPAPDATEKGELKEGVSSPKHKPMASAEEEPCTSLNKQFGWSVKTRSGPFEDPFSFAVCTEAPWFAEVEVVKVEEADETGELGPGHLLLHVKYNPPLPAAFPSKMPSKIPLAPSQIMTPSVDDSVGPPRPGDKATVLCLEVGKPLLFSSQVENDTAYLEFLPGPWSVQVDVELYADVSRPMGVGARLRVRDNVAVTLPPSRLLPFPTEGLRPEEWVLLELADLHSQQQRQSGETDGQETDELDRLELWDKVQREGALEAFATRQCRLRRGEKFGDPVQLDCLPDLKAQTGKELVTNGLEIVRRGVIGLALTLISTMGVNAAFHSLIRSNDSFAQRMEKAATELSLFNLKREWKLEAPLEAWKNPDAEDKIMEIARKGWTPQQTELLDEIASEMLQLYAQGAKDRRKHKTEGKIKFEESDDKLVIRVPVSNLSYRRRHILGVLFEKELELVFTFVDRGGQFHPFHKISTAQGGTAAVDEQKGILETTGGTQPSQGITAKPVGETALEAAQAGDKETVLHEAQKTAAQETSAQERTESTAKEASGQQLESVSANRSAQMKMTGDLDAVAVAKDKPGRTKDNGEECITYLQLLWQKVGEPQHRELKRTAVANIVWDVGLSATFLIMAFITAKLMGSANGRTVADMLRERRTSRLASLRVSEFDIIPVHFSDTHVHEASFKGSLRTEEAAVPEAVETDEMLGVTPVTTDWV